MAAFNSDNNDGIIAAGIDKNLSDLGECVRNLKTSFDDTGIPIDDDNITFHRLCQKLEYLVGVGLKESSSVFGRTRSTWHYINACLAKSKKMHDGIRFVRGVHEVKTSAGKLRSFMRFCLVHQCLADTLQQCLMQEDITAQYYSSNSLFMKKNLTSDFLGTLYEFSEVQYDLAPTGYDLDVGWPTFARKQFGNFNWNRSTSRLSTGGRSISSLAFSFTQDSQSISSFHSELTSPISPVDMTSGGGEPVSSNNPTNVFNSTMTSTASTSPERSGEDDGFVSTIRQLTEEKEDLTAQLESLSQQLDQERENGRNVRMRMEAERSELEEKLAVQDQQLQQQTSQVEDVLADKERQIISLREELQAVKFDLGTRQLEQEKNQQAYRRQEEELGSALDRLKENEDLIGNLQDQLYHLKSGSRDEKQSLDSQLRQLELALMTRNEECEGLVNELRSTVAELDQLRTQFKELDETVLELRMTESRLKGENQSLKDESVMLRHKIVQLVQEKDSLWKHSDKLLHLHRVQATDQWIADGSIRDCQGCQTKFTLFVRRHHCRLCGRIFCHNCSDHWLSIAASKRPERTCQECFSIHDQFSRPDAAEQLLSKPTLEDVTDQIPSAESTCAGFSVISDGEIVSSLNESSPYSVSPVHQSADGSVKKVIRTAGIRPFESLLLAGRAVSGADQEVGSAAAVPSEAFLSAAMVHRVPLLVDQPGCTLHWKFKSDPKSIAFAVVGKSDEEGNSILKEEEEFLDRVIVGTALHPSDEDFVVGSAVLPEPGTYYVYFDNSYSRFSANKVTFYLSLTLPC